MNNEIDNYIQKRRQSKTKTSKVRASFVLLPEGKLAEQISGDTPQFLVYEPDTTQTLQSEAVRNGKDYIYPVTGDLVDKAVIKFPTGTEPFGNTESLRIEIKEFIHDYLDIHPFYLDLASYYVLLTWLYDRLDTVTYLGIFGDYGSGKTRAAQTIGTLCYKPAFVSGSLTCAPIYRILEQSRGTLVINEFDFNNSDMGSELIKILNNGYERGLHVLRVKNESGVVEAFDAFGPKIFTYRNKKKDQAFESRLITLPVEETTREDIPVTLPKEFEQRATKLRNQLLMFRFQNYHTKPTVDPSIFEGIERRLRQTLYPLITVIDDKQFLSKLKKFIQDYQQQAILDRGLSWQAENLQALVELTCNSRTITVGDFADKVNQVKPDTERKISARRAGSIIRNQLKLKTSRLTSGERKGEFEILIDSPKIQSLCLRYGVEIPKESSLHPPSSPTSDQESGHSEQSEGLSNPLVEDMTMEEVRQSLF